MRYLISTWLLVKVWRQIEDALEESLRQEYHLDALGQLSLLAEDSRVGLEVPHGGDFVAEAATKEQYQQAADLHEVPLIVHHSLGSPQDLEVIDPSI